MSRAPDAFSDAALPLFGHAPDTPAGELPYVAGHRQRLRTRFNDGGPDAMPDYELLELILFNALPRGDVKPLAHRLIREFGDYARVLSAPKARLLQVKGLGERAVTELKIVEAAAHRLARAKMMNRTVLGSWDAVVEYCQTRMALQEVEHFRVLLLDRQNRLIADEELARGTVDHVPVYPREVAKRALEKSASAILLVHNHPSGDPSPSEADIVMTKKIHAACKVFDITLHDHLIIGQSQQTSLRSLGHI
ncbi:MAG: DNA repair protein RadC [Pseudomonadota bacterium]